MKREPSKGLCGNTENLHKAIRQQVLPILDMSIRYGETKHLLPEIVTMLFELE